MYHQRFAGNCIETPNERCFSDGFGSELFDCSGFVIKSISNALDLDVLEQAKKARHVRDMWRLAQDEDAYSAANFAVGSLVVFRRKYTIRNEKTEIPGHIGIITNTNNGIDVIHANIRSGRVEEEPMQNIGAAMGCLAINLSTIEERQLYENFTY